MITPPSVKGTSVAARIEQTRSQFSRVSCIFTGVENAKGIRAHNPSPGESRKVTKTAMIIAGCAKGYDATIRMGQDAGQIIVIETAIITTPDLVSFKVPFDNPEIRTTFIVGYIAIGGKSAAT